MAEQFEPLPRNTPMTEKGFLSDVWRRFFETVLGNSFTRTEALEKKVSELESRIETLESP